LNQPRHHSTVGFRVVGTMKLVSGAFMFAAGIGIFRTLHSDIGELLEHYATRLHLDPDNRLVHFVLTRVGGISHERLKLIGAGTFIYAIVHFIEGFGLIFLQRWAEYLTVILTGSLMPLELYEIYEKVSPIRISVFVVNLAIVIYLIYKLQQENKSRKEEAKGSAASG
jgi:uncharacterized membrane protein (DUF2068 family)